MTKEERGRDEVGGGRRIGGGKQRRKREGRWEEGKNGGEERERREREGETGKKEVGGVFLMGL